MLDSYFLAKVSTIIKYAIIGVMGFVIESPIRYATCVKAGSIFININIGTKIGLKIAHLAALLEIKMLISEEIKINNKIKGNPFNPIPSIKFAHLIEMINPKLLQLKNAIICEATSAKTINVPIPEIALFKCCTISLSDLNFPANKPYIPEGIKNNNIVK